jgi:hypothetical protein
MLCKLCHDHEGLFAIQTEHYGNVDICVYCLATLVDNTIAEREQWAKDFCKGCQQSTGDGCLQNVTPETCA